MKLLPKLLTPFVISLFAWAAPGLSEPGPRILAIGDSLMAAHKISGRSISHAVSKSLGVPVVNRSVLGARMIYRLPITGAMGFNIGKQYWNGKWDYIILNGGGNDLWLGCGCLACKRKINKLISKDGRKGKIPGLVSRMRKSGAHVIYLGYLRSPGVGSPIEHCRDEGNELEARIARLAELDSGITFVSLADLVPSGDRSFHGFDMIHPSIKGSARIGQLIANVIRQRPSS